MRDALGALRKGTPLTTEELLTNLFESRRREGSAILAGGDLIALVEHIDDLEGSTQTVLHPPPHPKPCPYPELIREEQPQAPVHVRPVLFVRWQLLRRARGPTSLNGWEAVRLWDAVVRSGTDV